MSSDVSSSLRALLDEADVTWEANQTKVKKLNAEIGKAAKELPRVGRGRESDPIAELEAQIEDLEYNRGSSSMSLSDEKDVVRKIAGLKRQKQQFAEFAAMKDERDRLVAEQDALATRRQELREGLKTLLLTERIRELNPGVSIGVGDITSSTITVQANLVGRIVGKGGATRQQIEKECGVTMDVQDKSGGVCAIVLNGTVSGIASATSKIEDLSNVEEELVVVEGGLANLLLSRGGAGIKQLESETGVHAQMSRSDGGIKLMGGPRCVAEAKTWLATVQDSRVIMAVPVPVLPAVIGQAGANFKRIQETHRVEIDVRKPGEGAPTGTGYTLTVWGIDASALEAARGEILHIISANTKHCVAVAIDPAMVPYLVSSGAERVKAFQKANNVQASVRRAGHERPGRSEEDEDVVVPPGATAWVEIRGTKAALEGAEASLQGLIHEFDRVNVRIPLSSAQARAVIGKGGEGIKKLRADTGANIDVEIGGSEAAGSGKGGEGESKRRQAPLYDLPAGKAVAIIRCEDPDKLEAARAAVASIADAYTERSFAVSEGVITALIRNGGGAVSKLQSDTGANIDIDRAGGKVVVSGVDAAVAAASAAIEDIIAANYTTTVAIQEGDMVGAIVGKKGENLRKLQEGHETHVDIDKSKNVVTIRGRKADADAVAERVNEFMARYAKENATLTVDVEFFSTLIGKEGANVRKLQEDTGATIDVNSKTGEVRVRGPEDAVKAAVEAITAVCGLDKFKALLPYDERAIAGFLGKSGATVKALSDELRVSISLNREKKSVTIRGDKPDVEAAKTVIARRLKELIRVEENVNFVATRMAYLMGNKGTRIRQLQSVLGVMMDVPKPDAVRTARTVPVTIKGQEDAVRKAKSVVEAISKGQAVTLLQLLPQHAGELVGRSARNLERLRVLEGANIDVNAVTGTVTILADESVIVKVTSAVENVVAFSYPNEYALVPVPAALLSQLVGDAATGGKGGGKASGGDATEAADDSLLTLAKLAAKTEAKLWPNIDGGYVTVCGSPAQVASAKTALTDFVAAAADRYAEVPLEEWMIPIVVGPKGAKIMELQQSSGARLDVDKQKLLVTIQGSNKEAITSAKTTLTELIHRLAAQRVVLKSTPAAVMAIIGRGGTTIRRLQDETGAMIDVNRDTGVVTVRGSDALLVQTAVERVKALLADTPSDGAVLSADAVEKRVTVDKRSIAVVIGAGGSTVRRLQDETGARISIDRDAGQVVLRGSEDAVVAAVTAVKAVIAAEKQAAKAERDEGEVEEQAAGASDAVATEAEAAGKPLMSFPIVPVGASNEAERDLLAAAAGKKLDKNARRRARKRETKVSEPEWADGLTGLSSSSDVLATLLGSSGAPPAPVASVVASSAVKKSSPPPPPGFSVAAGPDPLAMLAQFKPYSGPSLDSSAPSQVPSSASGATSKDDRKPDEPEEVPSGSEDDQGDGSDAEGGSDGNEGEGGEEKAGEGSGGEEGDAAAGGDDGGDDDGEEDEESFDEEEDDDDDDDDEDYDSEDGPGLAAIYESDSGEESDESFEVGGKRGRDAKAPSARPTKRR